MFFFFFGYVVRLPCERSAAREEKLILDRSTA